MSKPVPRSRLNISYRTRVEGTPKKAKLPMRFLVLGNFSSVNDTLLSERAMHSILPGMKVDSFMQELRIAAPLESPGLAMRIEGAFAGTITGVWKRPPEPTDETATLKLTGTATVVGRGKDNGLGDFQGEVTLTGEHEFPVENGRLQLPPVADAEPATVKLQVRGKVEPPGEVDAGITGSVDTVVELVIEKNEVEAGTDLSIELQSAVKGKLIVALTIPLRSIADFHPDRVAARVPEIRRLVLLRRLALELRSYISSNPLLGVTLREQLEQAEQQLADAQKAALAGAPAESTPPDPTIPAPRLSQETTLAQLQAALVASHPELLVEPPARPAVTPN